MGENAGKSPIDVTELFRLETEVRVIAKEAYLYGFPIVEAAYKTLYAQAVDKGGSNFKAPFNQIGDAASVFTPKDTAIITPNSDTPYSFVWMDLRAEPVVLTLPAIEEKRYYSVQLVDLYTQNFAYLGKRTTGRKGGSFLIAGPTWRGQKPPGITRVVRCETEFAYALYRTQLFSSDDLDNVKRVQSAATACRRSARFSGSQLQNRRQQSTGRGPSQVR